VLLVSEEPVLRFKEVKYIHSGYYYCYGVYKNKKNHFIAMRTLKVYGTLFFSDVIIAHSSNQVQHLLLEQNLA